VKSELFSVVVGPDDERPQVWLELPFSILWCGGVRCLLRQDAHRKYGHELDVLHALGDPQSVKTTEL